MLNAVAAGSKHAFGRSVSLFQAWSVPNVWLYSKSRRSWVNAGGGYGAVNGGMWGCGDKVKGVDKANTENVNRVALGQARH